MTKSDMPSLYSYFMKSNSCRRCGTEARPLKNEESVCPACNQPNQLICPKCGWKSEIKYHIHDPRVDKATILATIKNRKEL